MNEHYRNPYAPPGASVADEVDDGYETLIPGGRAVPMGNAANWLSGGWEMFRQQPLPWIAMVLVFGGISVVGFIVIMLLSMIIPFFNATAAILATVLVGGIACACDNQRQTGELNVGDLFAGFRRNVNELLLCGLILMAINIATIILAFLPVLLFGGIGLIRDIAGGHGAGAFTGGAFIVGLLIGIIVFLLGTFLSIAAMWFAPALIVLHDLKPIDAMKASVSGCLRNWASGLLFGLLTIVLSFIASVPLLLGWLVLLPVLWAATYYAYRDIYIGD